MTTYRSRTPWQVTRSVWQALFLREFLARVTADRLAWFWMLFEPIAIILIMVAVRTVALGRERHIAGAEFVPWILIGLLGFFLFRESLLRPLGAVESGRTLFSYRQVKPVDLVLVRCFLEGALKTFILAGFVAVGLLLGMDLFPDRFMQMLFAWLGLWLLGVGAGVVFSVFAALVPEIGKIVRLSAFPLLILSGALFPLNFLPHGLLTYLMLNPIVHGLELLRAGFFEAYRPLPGTDPVYLLLWVLGMLTLGFIVQLRFELRLKAL